MVAEEDPIVERGVGQGRAMAVVEVVRHLTDAPDAERILSGLVGEIDPELRLTRYRERIRIVVDIAGLEVVVPSVSESGGDALPLALETPHAQHVALVEQPRARVLQVEGVRRDDMDSVVDAIETKWLAHGDVIAHLGGHGVLVVGDVRHHRGAEESVLLQHLLPHLSAEGRIDGGEEDRLAAKVLVHPPSQRIGRTGKVSLDPEGVGERQSSSRRSE